MVAIILQLTNMTHQKSAHSSTYSVHVFFFVETMAWKIILVALGVAAAGRLTTVTYLGGVVACIFKMPNFAYYYVLRTCV